MSLTPALPAASVDSSTTANAAHEGNEEQKTGEPLPAISTQVVSNGNDQSNLCTTETPRDGHDLESQKPVNTVTGRKCASGIDGDKDGDEKARNEVQADAALKQRLSYDSPAASVPTARDTAVLVGHACERVPQILKRLGHLVVANAEPKLLRKAFIHDEDELQRLTENSGFDAIALVLWLSGFAFWVVVCSQLANGLSAKLLDYTMTTNRLLYSDAHKLPQIAFEVQQISSSDYTMSFTACTVPWGQFLSQTCTDLGEVVYECSVKSDNYDHYVPNASCLPKPSDEDNALVVHGTFGYETYTYVAVRITPIRENVTMSGAVNIFMRDHYLSLRDTEWHNFYYRIGASRHQYAEVYFKHQREVNGTISGFSGFFGESVDRFLGTESEDGDKGSSYDWQYTYSEDSAGGGFTFFLRSSQFEEVTESTPKATIVGVVSEITSIFIFRAYAIGATIIVLLRFHLWVKQLFNDYLGTLPDRASKTRPR